MSGLNEMARAKVRYEAAKDFAWRQAAQTLSAALGENFYITNLSNRALEAVNEWPLEQRTAAGGGWDWTEIKRRFSEMSVMSLAIWRADDRLVGLGLCRATSQHVVVEYAEGDPRPDGALRGKRLLIVLEAATNYAQKLGKKHLRLELVNETKKKLIEETYGFVLVNPRKGSPYYEKEI